MSVLLFDDPKIYAKVTNTYSKFKEKLGQGYTWHTYYLDERQPLIYGMYWANIQSWNKRYTKDEPAEVMNYEDFLHIVNNCNEEYPNIYQYLKSLEILEYQIEIDPEKSANTYIQRGIPFLKDLIHALRSIIIEETPYKDTKFEV